MRGSPSGWVNVALIYAGRGAIESAIDRLPPEEFRLSTEWFRECDRQHWDEQLDRGSVRGRLDLLFEEAEDESNKGLLRR